MSSAVCVEKMSNCCPKRVFAKDESVRAFLKQQFDKSGLKYEHVEEWLSKPPRFTTLRVNTLLKNDEEAVNELRNSFAKKSERLANKRVSVYKHSILEDLIVVEVDNDDEKDVVPNGKEVIVDVSCGNSVLRGAEVYCAGVLGAPKSLLRNEKVAVFADVEGKCLKGWKRRYNGEKIFVANGTSHVSRNDLFGSNPATGLAVEITECQYPSPSLFGNRGGSFFPQNLPSTLSVHVLDPKPGEKVLDMCAAPGGKATHIAALMRGEGSLIAIDKSTARVSTLRSNFERLGIKTGFEIYNIDALSLNDSGQDSVFQRGSFDKIIVDAPCSGLGQRPRLSFNTNVNALLLYPKTQKILLKIASELLKPGGILVYSTCSITLNENENVVDYILSNCKDLVLEPQCPYLGGKGLEGDHNLTNTQLELLQRFTNVNGVTVNEDTIGFFIAKFKKLQNCSS